MASLLVGQAAGVQVMPGNTTGTGARIRIRGTNSLSLVNDPIYIIDGVRMTSPNGSQSGNIFTGGAIQSRAQDLNPDEIENIEIVKGPSAATLYGTDAANGVIVITTKRGRAGATRYNVFGEAGAIHDYNTWPTAYTLLGHTAAAPTTAIRCTLSTASAGTCIPDSLAKFNLFEKPNTTPLGTGSRKSAGLQASGGSDIVRFFTSGEYEDEIGVLKIPNFDIQRLDTTGVNALQEWRQPNELTRSTMRANLNATPSPKLDLAVSTGFIHLMTRLPQSDNNALGLLSNGFGGPGFEGPGPGYVGISTLGYALHGYRASTPAESFQDVSTQMINRFIGSVVSPPREHRRRLHVADRPATLPSGHLRRRRHHAPRVRRGRSCWIAQLHDGPGEYAHLPAARVVQLEDNGRRAICKFSTRPQRLGRLEPDAGHADGEWRRSGVRGRVHRRLENARLLCRGARRLSRPALPHRRGAHGPEQRVRHELPARLLSEVQPFMAHLRRELLPASVVALATPAAQRVRRLRRAAWT